MSAIEALLGPCPGHPDAAVDLVVLGQLLNEHTAGHRLWRDMLQPPQDAMRPREPDT